jgi:hypothetical protein
LAFQVYFWQLALDRWWSSRDSPLPKYSFVLHPWSLSPHETTISIKKTLRALARSIAVCLVAEHMFNPFSKSTNVPEGYNFS